MSGRPRKREGTETAETLHTTKATSGETGIGKIDKAKPSRQKLSKLRLERHYRQHNITRHDLHSSEDKTDKKETFGKTISQERKNVYDEEVLDSITYIPSELSDYDRRRSNQGLGQSTGSQSPPPWKHMRKRPTRKIIMSSDEDE